MKLQLAFFDENDHMLYDWSSWANRLIVQNGKHGHESLDADISADVYTAAAMLRDRRPHRVQLNFGMWPVWDGRLEDIAAANYGFQPVAMGHWRALRDVPYTALWSTKRHTEFRPVTKEDLSNRTPGKFRMSTDNGVKISPVSGESFTSGGSLDIGSMIYRAPHLGDRLIKKITFSYDVSLPLNWVAQTVSVNDPFSSANTEQTITTSGSGTATITLGTDKDSLIFQVYNNSGLKGIYTGETEAAYAYWSNIRILTTDSASLYADEIVKGLLTFVDGINPGQLSGSVVEIESPAVDLVEEEYLDQWPADVIEGLAEKGDGSGQKYEAGVGFDKVLYFRPLGSETRVFYVDVANLVLSRTLDSVANSVYHVYRDERGRLRRTAPTANLDSIAEHGGLTRRRVLSSGSTGTAELSSVRTAELDSLAFPPMRTNQLAVERLTDAHGLDIWLWEVKEGDTVIIRNLPPELIGDDDSLAQFTASRTRYNPLVGNQGSLVIETINLAPTIKGFLENVAKGRIAASSTRSSSRVDFGKR